MKLFDETDKIVHLAPLANVIIHLFARNLKCTKMPFTETL